MDASYPLAARHLRALRLGVQTWSAPPRNHDWLAACVTLG